MICPKCNDPELFFSPEYDSDYFCESCNNTFDEDEVEDEYPEVPF